MKKFTKLIIFTLCWQWAAASFAVTSYGAYTKNPIVLIHGFMGFGDGMSWLMRYFGEVPAMLREYGAVVFIADLSQANTVEARGKELYQQLRSWGHQRYNLIGHSHGGLDARYVLEHYPEIVASVTTIGTPHRGSKVADILYDKMSRHRSVRLIFLNVADFVSQTISFLAGSSHELDIERSLEGLTTKGVAKFNKAHSMGLGKAYCADGPPEFFGRKFYSWGSVVTDEYPTVFMSPSLRLVRDYFWDNEEHDGLVEVCSMKFGTWLGLIDGHHLVPVGGVIGRISDEQRQWALEMFYAHAERLRADGL